MRRSRSPANGEVLVRVECLRRLPHGFARGRRRIAAAQIAGDSGASNRRRCGRARRRRAAIPARRACRNRLAPSARTKPANIAAREWKISATIPTFTGYTVDGGYAEYALARRGFRLSDSGILSRPRTPRRCCARESSDFAACGFRESSGAGGWRSTVSERPRTWPFKWRVTGAWKCTRARGAPSISSWRSNSAPCGRGKRRRSLPRSSTRRLFSRPPESLFPRRSGRSRRAEFWCWAEFT